MRSTVALSRRGVVSMLAALPAGGLLSACGRQTDPAHQPAVAIEKSDTCAVCGMFIALHPGPRGEGYIVGVKKPLKFGGGARDFFAFVTRPDVVHRLETLYVQDTARIDWAHPSDAADSFVDARTAYYVAWQPLLGEMGPAFASFARHDDAETFIQSHGGALLRFDEVTPDLVSNLTYACPPTGSPLYQLASKANCATKASTAPASPASAAGTPSMAAMPGMRDNPPRESR